MILLLFLIKFVGISDLDMQHIIYLGMVVDTFDAVAEQRYVSGVRFPHVTFMYTQKRKRKIQLNRKDNTKVLLISVEISSSRPARGEVEQKEM